MEGTEGLPWGPAASGVICKLCATVTAHQTLKERTHTAGSTLYVLS